MRKAVSSLFSLLAGVTELLNQRQFDNLAEDIMAFRALRTEKVPYKERILRPLSEGTVGI